MVQREVADRLFASPGTKAYGAVSVLVQLAAERTGFHPVPRTVFRPPPNVDSALVAFRRVGLPHDYPRIKRLVAEAFAHRRKTLPNSLELSGLTGRQEAAAALAAIGLSANARAESLAPIDFVALAEVLRLGRLLPGATVQLTGSASLRESADDLDLVALVDDVRAAAATLELPPLHPEQWRDDWAAFRVAGRPQVDVVLTVEGSDADRRHRLAWQLLADDPRLLAEYRAAKVTPEGKRAFFDRVAGLL
jgi:hypothetical protein